MNLVDMLLGRACAGGPYVDSKVVLRAWGARVTTLMSVRIAADG
jgi:hypothetical protein